jgi:tetratricopeptide (TPR) repeat protein
VTDSDELRSLVAIVRGPERKSGLFARVGKRAAGKKRLEASRRLAELAASGRPEPDLIEALEAAAGEYPDEQDIRLALARSLAAAGRSSEAIGEFEEYLRSHQDDGHALTAAAALYATSGRTDLAVERLQRAVDIFVKSSELDAAVSAARSLISLEPESLDRASELVAMLREREPKLLADALEHLANVYRERGKLGQEADACRELLALSPHRSGIRPRLSEIYSRILEVDPDDVDAWAGIDDVDPLIASSLRERLERVAAPESPTEIPASEDEPHLAYATRKARELMDAGDVVGASLCLERAAQNNPNPGARLQLARCYLALHRAPEAIRQALRSIALGCWSGDGASVDEALGWLVELRPDAAGPVGDAVFLNHRPESADMLYEELVQCWDDADSSRSAASTG